MKNHIIYMLSVCILFSMLSCSLTKTVVIKNEEELGKALDKSKSGDIIKLKPGKYVLNNQMPIKSGITIKGAGVGRTIITANDTWLPGLKGLPANERVADSVNSNAYLFKMEEIRDVTISDLTLTAPNLHGAVFANKCQNLNFNNLKFVDFCWSSIYTFDIRKFIIHDCVFENAGGKVKWLGAAIFNNRTVHGEFYNCKIYSTPGRGNNFVGFKGLGNDSSRIHHNTVETGGYIWGFCLEYMHSDNSHIEIDHNKFNERISIPKGGGGGKVNKGDYSFWIHHNWLTGLSEIIEGPRGYLIVDHNLIDMSVEQDGGNLYTDHDNREVYGPLKFYNNLIKNPGRGIFWSVSKYNNYSFYNNHVVANTTITPRKEGLFDFNTNSVFDSIEIKDNFIACNGLARPLLRNPLSNKALIENNVLINISDSLLYANSKKDRQRGFKENLVFKCGYRSEFLVNNWKGEKKKSNYTNSH